MVSRDFAQLLTEPQLERLQEAFDRGLSPLKTAMPLRCSVWANEHFWLSAESSGSGTEGPFDAWPQQIAILDCMGSDLIEIVSFRKSAGIGYTKMLTATDGYYHHHKRRNVLIYQPTDGDAKEFCKDTIDPMIRDVEAMGDLLRLSSKNNKENTLQTKYFLGSSLHIRGGTSANNFRRLRKDVVVYDELDGFDGDIEGEGDPVSLGDKRVRDSSFPKSIRGTTPTIDGQSQIQKSEADADLTFHFKVECPGCGHRQHFEWGGPEVHYGIKWHEDDPSTAHYVCIACEDGWDYSQLGSLLETGTWETEDGYAIEKALTDTNPDPVLLNPKGKECDWPKHVAFILWSAYSLTFPWPVMVREFLAAKDDPVLLKTFVNTTLGEYWKDTVTQVESEPLYGRREVYEQVPAAVRVLTIGADVQQDRIEYEVVGWGPGRESWSVHYGILAGDPTRDELWNTFNAEIRQPFDTEDGRTLKPKLVCVDCGYLSEEVYRFSRKAGIRFVVPVMGASTPGKPIAVFPRRPNDKRVYRTMVGTDNAKSTLYKRLLLEEPGPGFCHYPERDEYDEEYFNQLTGEEKRPFIRGGRKVLMFQQAYANVEALDCRVYNMAALAILEDRFGVRLDAPVPIAKGTARQDNVVDTPAPTEQKKRQRNRRRSSGGGFVRTEGPWFK